MCAFSGCHSLSDISIPDSVTKLESQIFRDCRSMKNIVIPSSITEIDSGVFVGCNSLTNIVIPKSVTSIDGNGQFSRCTALESIVVEEGNPVFDSRNCCNAIIETETNTLLSGAKNTTIPNTVTTIGHGAFFACFGMTNIEIPDSVIKIDQLAFANCEDLSVIVIPDSVDEIGEYAFQNCYRLIHVELSESLSNISRGVFSSCTALPSIEIPEGVTELQMHAFFGCTSLTQVKLPDSIISIDSHVFAKCSILSSINFPSSLIEIGFYTFGECGMLNIPKLPDTIKVSCTAFKGCGVSDSAPASTESSNDKFSNMDVRKIDNLPIDEYNKVINNMTDDEREEYFSKSSLSNEPFHPVVVESMEEDLEGLVNVEDFLEQLKKKYNIDEK